MYTIKKIASLSSRWWLRIPELRVSVLYRRTEEYESAFSVDIGPCVLHGTGIRLDKNRNGLRFSESGARFRFIDVPAYHEDGESQWPLLGEIFYATIINQWHDYFVEYLTGHSAAKELPAWRPPEWAGMELGIPIDFIQLYGFRMYDDGVVVADIQLGRHISFSEVPIYDGAHFQLTSPGQISDGLGEKRDMTIVKWDGFIGERLQEMWKQSKALREVVRRVAGGMPFDYENRFAVAVQNERMNSKKTPPRLCLWNGEECYPVECPILHRPWPWKSKC